MCKYNYMVTIYYKSGAIVNCGIGILASDVDEAYDKLRKTIFNNWLYDISIDNWSYDLKKIST